MSCLLPRKVISGFKGGSHPHLLSCRGQNLSPVAKKDFSETKKVSIRTIFRNSKHKFKVGHNYEAVPAVMSCHKDEHKQFLEWGAEACVPDFSHIDERTFRNFLVLYAEDHCHIDIKNTNMKKILLESELQNSEPHYGTRKYYSTMRPELLPAVKEDGKPDQEVMNFMLKVLKKFGGSMISLLIESFKLNPNLTAHIYKRGCKYGYKAGEMANPHGIRLCNSCGICNFIWLQHEEDKLKRQHCGVCFYPLDLVPVSQSWCLPEVIIDDVTQMGVGAMERKMAEVMNELDGENEFSHETTKRLISQDIRNMRSIMSRRLFKSIKVNNGMTAKQLSHLKNNNLSFQIIPNRSTPNPHAMIAAERKLIWNSFVEKSGINQMILDIGARKIRDESLINQWHGMGPVVDWRDVERYSDMGLPTNTCSHLVSKCDCLLNRSPLMIAIDSLYDISAIDIIDLMVRCKSSHLLYTVSTASVNFEAINGSLFFDQGNWYRDNSTFIMSLVCDDRPYHNDWNLTKMWSTADVITHNGWALHIHTYNVLGNHIMRSAILSKSQVSKPRYVQSIDVGQHFDIEVPIIQHDSWLANKFVPVINYETKTIDVNLFKALYARNLTGGLSYEKMVEFGLAYAHTKYTTPTRMVSYQHITADDVRLHAFLAVVHTRRKMNWLNEAEDLNDPKTTYGVSITGGLWFTVIEYILGVIGKYDGAMANNTIGNDNYCKLKALVIKWVDEPFWDLLDTLCDNSYKVELIHYEGGKLNPSEEVANELICEHHAMTCKHELMDGPVCKCCKMAQSVSNALCNCCANVTCVHKCRHTCYDVTQHMNGNQELKICECCQMPNNTGACYACKIWIGKDPTKQEPTGRWETKLPVQTQPRFEKFKVEMQKFKQRDADPKSGKVPKHPSTTTHIESQKVVKPHTAETSTLTTWMTTQECEPIDDPSEEVPIERHGPDHVEQNPQHQLLSDRDLTNNLFDSDMTEDDKLAMELTELASHEYTLVTCFGLLEAIQDYNVAVSDYNPCNVIGISQIRYMPHGISILQTDCFKVEQVQPVAGDGLCGYHAIKHVIGEACDLGELQALSQKDSWFDSDDLSEYLAKLGYNSVILLVGNSKVTTVNGMIDQYVCIRHGEVEMIGRKHWEPVSLLHHSIEGNLPCWKAMWTDKDVFKMANKLGISMRIETLSANSKLKLAVNLVKKYARNKMEQCNDQQELQMKRLGSQMFLTNNNMGRHCIPEGLVHVQVSNQFVNVMHQMCSSDITSSYEELIEQPFDVPDLNEAEPDDVMHQLMTETCAQIKSMELQASGKVKLQKMDWVTHIVHIKLTSGGYRYFTLDEHKLKTGDLIMIEQSVISHRCYVIVKNSQIYFESPTGLSQLTKIIKIHVPKVSYKSKLLLLLSINNSKPDWSEFKQVIHASKVTYGPAGSGKTTQLLNVASEGDTIIARTRVAKDNIMGKLRKQNINVMTYERFSTMRQPTDRLIIEECTMFTWVDLYVALSHNPKEIIMFGDPNQVGVIDTYKLGGTRDITPISDYSRNKSQLTYSYRYGDALTNILQSAGINVTSRAPHDTEITWINLDTLDIATVKQIVGKYQPNIILTFYNKQKTMLKKIFDTPVETIHSYQSREADVVMVIQASEEHSRSKIWLQREYCISAATRCRTSLIWVAVGLPRTANLMVVLRGDRLSIDAGGTALSSQWNVLTQIMKYERYIHSNSQPELAIVTPKEGHIKGGESSMLKQTRALTPDIWKQIISLSGKGTLYNWFNETMESVAERIREGVGQLGTVTLSHNTISIKTGLSVQLVSNENNTSMVVVYASWVGKRLLERQIIDLYEKKVDGEFRRLNQAQLEHQWFDNLHPDLKTVLHTNLRDSMGIVEVQAEPMQSETIKFYVGEPSGTLTERETISQEQKNEPQNEFNGIIKMLLPIGEQAVKRICSYTMAYVGVSLVKKKNPVISTVLVTCRANVVLKYLLSNEEMEMVITIDETQGLLTNNLRTACEQWNEVIKCKLQTTNLWSELTVGRKNYITQNFGEIVIGTSLYTTSEQQMFDEFLKKITEVSDKFSKFEDPTIFDKEVVFMDNTIKPTDITVHDPHNSDNGLHYCTDAESWWKTKSAGPEFEIDEFNPGKSCLTALRLLSETVQQYEDLGELYAMYTPMGHIQIETYGGCSLCSGLVFSAKDGIVMKISPQKRISYSRLLLMRKSHYDVVISHALAVLGIESDKFKLRVDGQIIGGSIKQWLHPAVLTEGYEIAMIIERLKEVPAVLWIGNWTSDDKKLCTQYLTTNENYILDVKSKLDDGWCVSPVNKFGSHKNCLGRPVKVTRGMKTEYCAVINGICYCTSSTVVKPRTEKIKTTLKKMVDNYFRHKCEQWPWKVGRWISKFLHMEKTNVGMDEDNACKALNLPMSFHKLHKTEVYEYFRKRMESEKLGNTIKVANIVFVQRQQYDRYRNILNQECVNMPIEIQSYDQMERGFDQLVEQIGLKYFYNGLPMGARVLAVTTFPYLAVASSCWGTFCHYVYNNGKNRYQKNLLDCNPIMKKITLVYNRQSDFTMESEEKKEYYHEMQKAIEFQNKTKTGPWFTEHLNQIPSKSNYLYFGLHCLENHPDKLLKTLKEMKVKKATMLCPLMFNNENQLFHIIKESDDNYEVAYDGTVNTLTINKQLADCILHGKAHFDGNLSMIFHNIGVVLGHTVMSIVVCDKMVKLPEYCKPQSQLAISEKIKFRVPKINDLRRAVANLSVLETKIIEIDFKLYRALTLRMLRVNTTFQDLLSYARAYVHSVTYSTDAHVPKLNRLSTTIMEACLCVYYESTRSNESMSELAEMVTGSQKTPDSIENIMKSCKMVLVNALGGALSAIGSSVTIDEVINMLHILLKKSPSKFLANMTKFTAVKITKEIMPEKIIRRKTGRLLYSDMTKSVTIVHDMLDNSASLAIGGLKRWWQVKMVGRGSAGLKTVSSSESVISKLCRQLENYVGLDLDVALTKVLTKGGFNINDNHLELAIQTILDNVMSPVECHPSKTNIQQLVEVNRSLRKRSIVSIATRSTNPVVEDHMRFTLNNATWMYEQQVNKLSATTILFSTIGSMGDVEPFVSMAIWLRELGTKCKFFVPDNYVHYVTSLGFECMGLNVESNALIDTCIKMEDPKAGVIEKTKLLYNMFELTSRMFEVETFKYKEFVMDCDLVLETPFTHIGCQLAQSLSKPLMLCATYPWEYAHGRSTKAETQSLSEFLAGALTYAPFVKNMMEWREKKLGLSNQVGTLIASGGTPMLYLHPAETTFWRVSECSNAIGYAEHPAKQLTKLEIDTLIWASEQNTAAICFGSMVGEKLNSVINNAISKLPDLITRIIVVTSNANIQVVCKEGMDHRIIKQINYHSLFAICKMVVTHGGSGTTHNALKHGRPVLIKPFFGDQFAWLKSVKQLGVGWGVEDKHINTSDKQKLSNEDFNQASEAALQLSKNLSDYHMIANFVSSYNVILETAGLNTKQLLENNYWQGKIDNIHTKEKFSTLKTGLSKVWADDTSVTITAAKILSNVKAIIEGGPIVEDSASEESLASSESGYDEQETYEADGLIEQLALEEDTVNKDGLEQQEIELDMNISMSSLESTIAQEPLAVTTEHALLEATTQSAPKLMEPIKSWWVEFEAFKDTDACCGSTTENDDHLQHEWPLSVVMDSLTILNTEGKRWHCHCSVQTHGELFNPNVEGTCVQDCLLYVMEMTGLIKDECSRRVQIVKEWCTMSAMPTFYEIVNMVALLGLQVVILGSSGNILMNYTGKQKTSFGLLISYNKGMGHCSVFKVSVTTTHKQLKPGHQRFPTLTKCVNKLLTDKGLELEDFMQFTLCRSTYMRKIIHDKLNLDTTDLRARLQLKGLYYTLQRHIITSLFAIGSSDGVLIHYKNFPHRLKLGQLVLVAGLDTYIAAMAIPTDEDLTVIPLSMVRPFIPTGNIILTEIKLMKDLDRKIKTVVKLGSEQIDVVTNLNAQTLNYVTTSTNLFSCNTIMRKDAKHLLIYHCDGRSHHKYNELEIISSFEPINIHGVGFDYTMKLHTRLVNQNCGYRFAILHGVPCAVFEVKDKYVQQGIFTVLSIMKLKPKIELNSVIISLAKIPQKKEKNLKILSDNVQAEKGLVQKCTLECMKDWRKMDQEYLKLIEVDYDAASNLLQCPAQEMECKLEGKNKVTADLDFEPVTQTCVMVTNRVMCLPKFACNMVVRRIDTSAGHESYEQVLWKNSEEHNVNQFSRWWDISVPMPATQFEADKWRQRINTEAWTTAFNDVQSNDQMADLNFKDVKGNSQFFVPITEWQTTPYQWNSTSEIPTTDDICLWEDTDLTDWNEKFAPENEVNVTSRVPVTNLRETIKSTLVEHPKHSRSVLTKAANQEFNAVTGRLCRVVKYRQHDYDVDYEWNMFVEAYFDKNKLGLLAQFKHDQLNFSDTKVLEWLRDRPDSNKIAAELEMILQEGIDVNPINNIKVHLKLESLLKEEPAKSMRQVKARPLMWQTKGYCAIFSHVFKEVKARLKELLKDNIVYSDGLRADELAARVRAAGKFNFILENDLAQQDRQTDHEIIKFEMRVYKELGMNPGMVDLWHKCHFHWKYKAATVMGVRDAMRLTGQATTAIGNLITNLLVHRRLVKRMADSLKLFLALGDDGLMLTTELISVDKLNNELKIQHNMMCKPIISETYGTFCCMLVCKNHLGDATLGPDVVRLKRRFEVTNGVSESNDINLNARAMSYAMMIGRTTEVEELVKNKGWPIEPMRWYDSSSIFEACANKYGMSMEQVLDNYHELIKMMKDLTVWEHKFLHWEEKL